MRLIDADALKEKIYTKWGIDPKYMTSVSFNAGQDCYVLETLNSAPTIEAEPVVHCKDCKWWNRNSIGSDGFALCNEMNGQSYWQGSDYCSWGVKMDEVE